MAEEKWPVFCVCGTEATRRCMWSFQDIATIETCCDECYALLSLAPGWVKIDVVPDGSAEHH